MYKVRTLPVRFGTKQLGEDRSSLPLQQSLLKPQRDSLHAVHPGHSLQLCLLREKKAVFVRRYGAKTWLFFSHPPRAAVQVRAGAWTVRLVQLYHKLGGVWRKYLRIFFSKRGLRGQQLGLTAGTDFLWTPLQCLKRQGDKFNITQCFWFWFFGFFYARCSFSLCRFR